jgi:hypothetical protein
MLLGGRRRSYPAVEGGRLSQGAETGEKIAAADPSLAEILRLLTNAET